MTLSGGQGDTLGQQGIKNIFAMHEPLPDPVEIARGRYCHRNGIIICLEDYFRMYSIWVLTDAIECFGVLVVNEI